MISKIAGASDIQRISYETSIKEMQKKRQQDSKRIQKIDTDNNTGTQAQQNKPQDYKSISLKKTNPITEEESFQIPYEEVNNPTTQIKEGTLEDYYKAQLALAMVKKDFLLKNN